MLRNVLLILLALLVTGCSAERRDVLRYFESMQPYFAQFDEVQSRLKQVAALPHPERAAAYRALAKEAKETSAKIAAVKAPPATQAYHQQYTSLWNDFVAFTENLADVVDTSLPAAKREEANKQMESLQAAWAGKLQAVMAVQKQLGQQFGIDFQ